MSLLRAPLLGFKAQGSIGKKVTFSGVKQGTIIKSIPTHLDAQTGAQVAHRRRFTNARYYWHALAQSQRDAYETAARPYHMIGWAYFLKHYLATDPNQVLWLPFDQGEGSVAYDLSSRNNHGTIFGASWSPGKIDGCLSFDSVDDYVNCPDDPTFHSPNTITLHAWIYPKSGGEANMAGIITKQYIQNYHFSLFGTEPRLVVYFRGFEKFADVGALTKNQWQTVTATFDNTLPSDNIKMFVNAQPVGVADCNWVPLASAHPVVIGNTAAQNRTFDGFIEEARIFNVALSLEQIKRISLKEFM